MHSLFLRLFIYFFSVLICFIPVSASSAVVVPNVLGKSIDDAKRLLQQQGIQIGSIEEQPTDRDAGTVIVQTPPPEHRTSANIVMKLVVAVPLKKQALTATPDLKKLNLSEAKRKLSQAGLSLGQVKRHPQKTQESVVLYQSPLPGESLFVGSKVDLTISVPISLRGARVTLALDSDVYSLNKPIELKAKIDPIRQNAKPRYAFTIDGKVHYSPDPIYTFKAEAVGLYKITASARYGSEAWISSATRVIKVEEVAEVADVLDQSGIEIETSEPEESQIAVPDLKGLSTKQADLLLDRQELKLGKIESRYIESGDELIQSQDPSAGALVPIGSEVAVTQSVIRPWDVPKATIIPSTQTVAYGAKARFRSDAELDERAVSQDTAWSSDAVLKNTDQELVLDTRKLIPGKYRVVLTVTDDKGHSDRAVAMLLVEHTEESYQDMLIAESNALRTSDVSNVRSSELELFYQGNHDRIGSDSTDLLHMDNSDQRASSQKQSVIDESEDMSCPCWQIVVLFLIAVILLLIVLRRNKS